jgi:small subunit ribosomal protein S2
MKDLLEAGVHFGHRRRRWHPKMRSFIFTERNGIHIIDLQQTIARLEVAYDFVRDLVAEGGVVLFVGTKRQAQDNVREQAERCSMPYVVERWLGGTLTNFRTIRQRIDYMLSLEEQQEQGQWDRLTKKEALDKERELEKLHTRFGGIRTLKSLPDVVFISDIMREENAVQGANSLDIPIIAMVDTNCDPDPIDYPIPANDDAIRAIKLVATKIADAVIEGHQMREAMAAEEAEQMAASQYMEEMGAEFEAEDLESAPRIFEPDEEAPVEEVEEFEFVEAEDEMMAAETEVAEPREFYAKEDKEAEETESAEASEQTKEATEESETEATETAPEEADETETA